MIKTTMSERGKQAERALQEAVADAVSQHRRAGRPLVVNRRGKPALVDPKEVGAVREGVELYGTSGVLCARLEEVTTIQDDWLDGQGKAKKLAVKLPE